MRKNSLVKENGLMNEPKQESIKPVEFSIRTLTLSIVGTTPLIVNRMTEATRKNLEGKIAGVGKAGKHPPKDAYDDFEGSKHKSPLGWEGFPVSGFKAAIIRGAKIAGEVMTDTVASLFIIPDCLQTNLIRIYGKSTMRTDVARNANGNPDVRYRAEYRQWAAILKIEYNAGMISKEKVIQCVVAAGYGCGIGDWRPSSPKSKNGVNGRFEIGNEKILNKILNQKK